MPAQRDGDTSGQRRTPGGGCVDGRGADAADPMEAVARDRFHVSVEGARYAGYDSGGPGPAVLFLHGWPDESSVWRHQYRAAVDAGFRALAVDWIGHGRSERLRDPKRYEVARLSRDLAAVLDAREIETVHCVAHDWGAVAAWQFVTLYPARVLSYCALSIGHTAAIIRTPSLVNLLKSWFLIYNALPFAVPLYKAARGRFFRLAMAQHPDRARVVARFMADPDPYYIQAWELGNPLGPHIRSLLFKPAAVVTPIQVPTLGLWGSRDAYAGEAPMRRSGDYVKGTYRFVCLEQLGHWPQLEDPDRVNAVLLEWLTEQVRSSR